MNYRKFGNTGEKISALGFGCMRFPEYEKDGKMYVDQDKVDEMVAEAYRQGVNYFDTAPKYCNCNSEEAVGRAVKGFRDKVLLSTKIPLDVCKKPGDYRRALEHSLDKLGTDHLDFYHFWGINRKEFDQTIMAQDLLADAAKAKEEGLIRHISFSFHDEPLAIKYIIDESKKRGISIIMDLVINHCSDKHEWFKKALADPDGEYADYFFFREGKNGNPPSNYRSYFGGSCWEPVPNSNKYYLHMFAKEQPDLNWENPTLLQKLYDMINWWLEKGLGGFRIDAIINIKKDPAFPDYEPDGDDGLVSCWEMVEHVNGVGDYLEELKKHTFEKYDAFTVGEVFNMKGDELREFIGEDGHFSSIFDFSAACLSDGKHGWYDSPSIEFKKWRETIIDSQLRNQNYGFESNIIENHDEPRGVSRFLPEYAHTPSGAKMLGTINVLLRGLPFLYQGQEIGMQNAKWNSIDEFDDISTKDQYHVAKEAGLSDEAALEACSKMSRDNARTPMQWTDGENAGFTTGTPWLKVNSNYTDINVKNQEADAHSVLNYYRKLIALRKSDEYKSLFTYGEFVPVYNDTESIMAFYRKDESKCVLIAANFGKEPASVTLKSQAARILLSTRPDGSVQIDTTSAPKLTLDSCEAVVIEL